MSAEPVWDEEFCRRYADNMRPLARYDHRGVATKIARHLAGLKPGASVVEVASGPGFLTIELARLLTEPSLTLVDSAPAMLRLAAQEAANAGVEAHCVESPAERIALPDACADVVLCKNLMNCIDPALRVKVIHELTRLLAPGGRAFVVDFDVQGSHLAALLIGLFSRLLVGAEFHRDFRAAFARRLDSAPLSAAFAEAGCITSTERFGASFLLVARRGE
jgi:ubiquinone/menaquinone biosynthesis C-methylase UbiE